MASEADYKSLDRSLVRSVAWTGAAKWSTQIVSWAALVVVARLLTPQDFGLVGMASVFLGFVGIVNEMGLGSAVVSIRDLSASEMAQANGLALGMGVLCFGVSCAMAVPIGWLFDAPALPPVVVALGITFVISSLKTVPAAIMQREFRFRFLAVTEACQAVVLAVIQCLLAWWGFRYWTIVLGEILALAVATAMVVSRQRVALALPRFSEMRRVVRFTTQLLVSRICWYVYSNADFVVVGKALGQTDLGHYKIAWNLSTSPLHKISELVNRVTPSVFSAVQREPEALRRYVSNIAGTLSLAVFPASLGLAIVADDLVRLALGPQWEASIVPLRLLSIFISFRVVSSVLAQVLTVTGDTRFGMWNGIFSVVLLPASFVVAVRWGTAGVAAAWIVAYPISVVPMYFRVLRRIGLGFRGMGAAVIPSTVGSAIMCAAVLGARAVLPSDASTIVRLAIQIGVGAAAYGAVVFGLFGSKVRRLVGALRRAAKPAGAEP